MKKKIIFWIAFALIMVLIIPIPSADNENEGTKVYQAVTYRIVHWDMETEVGRYENTRVYFLPKAHYPMDMLWFEENDTIDSLMIATVVEINGDSIIVAPREDQFESLSADRLSFSRKDLPDLPIEVGTVVDIVYSGVIMETYPARIKAVQWSIRNTTVAGDYSGHWLTKSDETKFDGDIAEEIHITEIYEDCFFATSVIPMPYTIKINGTIADSWCVGDQVSCTYENIYYDTDSGRVEADLVNIQAAPFDLGDIVCYKPVIYLYPQEKMGVSVQLQLNGELTCTYPAYNDGWNVTALPDGTLTDEKGQTYNYLYWEGKVVADYDFSRGFCVKGEDTAKFLETALDRLGLTRKEANEFIVYWLPFMQENPYNVISFQTEAYCEAAALTVTPAPDTLIRVFMTWRSADSYVSIPEQILVRPHRVGFTVVEWGGTELS